MGLWRFDECTGTTAYDASGKGNNGTITIGGSSPQTSAGNCVTTDSAAAWYNGKDGKYNSSLNFDGTDDYVDLFNTVQFDSGNFAVCGWFKTGADTTAIYQQIWNSGYNGGNEDLEVATNANKITFYARDSAGVDTILPGPDSIYSTNNLNNNSWHHFVAMRSGSVFSLYIDGVFNDSASVALGDIDAAGVVPRIGNGLNSINTRFFNGQIDDVCLYNYALTGAQIKTLYNENSAIRFGPLTGSP